ncbi:hypothetical protein [Spiroplasma sp. SV19]|uniref:hypothetical protein n=1 Tax=Spiroplasma sp. SV19 TaxID=2570468 RepID=UPI0024B68620|nr:hypothetical protein [Spiroplasma sp. SV19]WHQ37066.1 hypothetical protein E7Y35_04110 [Spiroplasma sp. SV19]
MATCNDCNQKYELKNNYTYTDLCPNCFYKRETGNDFTYEDITVYQWYELNNKNKVVDFERE